ncbi:MAG: bifunctional phosphoribosylaminoimidazolecarboxamide formyltransferase/IMP cyclohydrolase [Pseudomonadota bacterium]
MNVSIRRALLSVSDKTGVVDLARALVEHGCELVSTGGTAAALRAAGLEVTDIQAVSGNPEAFGGRMKTISFTVESALLFDRERDAAEATRLGVEPIDLVACNLYPFEAAWRAGADLTELVEQIDIGGPTMLRAAAKNFRYVAALCRPEGYPAVIAELKAGGGSLSLATRRRLLRETFEHCADYDAAIAVALAERAGTRSLRLAYEQPRALRYGENSHQPAAFLRQRGAGRSLHDLLALGGKALSYNNIVDLQAALEAVAGLAAGACAVVKHTNPCGLAQGADQAAAFAAAWAGDPTSAFGSVIAFNAPLGLEAAHFLCLEAPVRERRFVEVVAAPAFEPGVVEYLSRSENLRIVRCDPAIVRSEEVWRFVPGGLLVQGADLEDVSEVRVVTAQPIDPLDEPLLRFGLHAVRCVKSNAIVLVRRQADGLLQLLGMGAGQPNRVDSTRIALARARQTLAAEAGAADVEAEEHIRAGLAAAYLVSDAFFPFPDSVELAAEAGLRTLFQPGGSIRDKAVVRRCDELGLAMAMTGLRHFKH